MNILWISLAFAAGFMIVAGMNLMVSDIVAGRRHQLRKRLEEDMRLRQAERARSSMPSHELYEMAAEGFANREDRISGLERFRRFVGQSGINAKPEQILAIAFLGALIVGGLVGFFSKSAIIGVVLGIVASIIPFLLVSFNRTRRRNKLRSQLPDAYEMMGRVLRAGQTISQAMRGVADEFSSPLGEEFAYCWEQQNLGLSPEASLRELGSRTGILEIQIFVVALMIHRQSGGNLSQLLNKLSAVIRERQKMDAKIQALTAEGKVQAYVLCGLPFFIAVIISVLNPTYMAPLLKYPMVFVVAGCFMVTGVLWMQKIINFDY